MARTAAPWRNLRAEFGQWNSVFRGFSRLGKTGVWSRILEQVSEAPADNEGFVLVRPVAQLRGCQAYGAHEVIEVVDDALIVCGSPESICRISGPNGHSIGLRCHEPLCL
jgi:hypothetical protein